MLFFSQHRGFAGLLLIATFVHPWAGAAGLSATVLAVLVSWAGGFNRELTKTGAYSFNALLTGLALGTLYAPSPQLVLVTGVGAVLAFGLSVALGGWLGGRGLPFLSLPFVGVLWMIGPGAGSLLHLQTSEWGVFWLSDLYAVGGKPFVEAARWVSDWTWPPPLTTYLRALSGVLIQDSPAAGLLVAAGLLWHSRMAFSLSVLGFLAATGFVSLTSTLTGEPPGGLDTYNLGANYMLTVLAVGSVYLLPKAGAYLLALFTVPLTAVLLSGLAALLGKVGLPVYSLPFCLNSLLLIYVLLLRETPSRWLPLTPVQQYSPERNLYAYTTHQERFAATHYFPLFLPFLGEWRCSQGYTDGGPTHKGDWGQALDFDITDADGRTYQGTGTALTDFYCFDKPVLAAADGLVEEVVSHLPDNRIGDVDTRHNWGNTVVLRHAVGLYTQVSHLRADSVRVKVGEFVRRGDVLGTCGSSGRSPEPHVHFQVQGTPSIGSRTLAYPLAEYRSGAAEGVEKGALRRFAVPQAGETVSAAAVHRLLSQALRMPPGYAFDVQAVGADGVPTGEICRWEVATDAYNLAYLWCHTTGAVAYFQREASVFYFTTFYGPESAWLYLFYRAAYWLPLSYFPGQEVRDVLPLTVVRNPLLRAAQDMLAPFVRFIHPHFRLRYGAGGNINSRSLTLHSDVVLDVLGRSRTEQETDLLLQDGALAELTIRRPHHPNLTLRCTPASV